MNEENMPPKNSTLLAESQTVMSLIIRLKELKDKIQLKPILLQFLNLHSSNTYITSIFNDLGYDSIQQQFASPLSFDKVISLLESKTTSIDNSMYVSVDQEAIESKQEDNGSTIIKKPIPTSIIAKDNNCDSYTNEDHFSNAKNDKLLLYHDRVFEINSNSMNNSLLFCNNNLNLPPFSFSNKINNNDGLKLKSPFHKIISDPIEEFKLNIANTDLLKKKRAKTPVDVADTDPEPNENKRSLRASSTVKNYKTPLINCKKKTQNNQGRTSGFGLKEISNRVKEIIKRSGTTSYKEISDEIVSEINEKDSKDEKNIRRRIYDSLNVMKSMKLFKKDKSTKKIIWTFIDEIPQNQIAKCNNKKEDNIDQLEYIKTLNQEIRIKQTKYNTLQREYKSLNTVLDRNKSRNDSYEEKTKILFPFIIIEFPNKSGDSKVKVSMNETKTQAHFAFDSADKLYGDLDAISKIGHNIAQCKKQSN